MKEKVLPLGMMLCSWIKFNFSVLNIIFLHVMYHGLFFLSSFFNRQEIEVVTDYIKRILADKVASPKEIGVVTPYNMQVCSVHFL